MLSQLTRSALAFLKDEDGPTAVEYAVMMALIIVVCMASVTALGTTTGNTYGYVATQVKVKGS
jgi:pilus assembly protein Flp/PilA